METFPLLEAGDARKAILFAKSYAHKSRRRIIQFLLASPDGSNVTDLFKALDMGQSECSAHLAHLRKCGFVATERQGKEIIYAIKPEQVKQAGELIGQLAAMAA